jgi:hypothetical protein
MKSPDPRCVERLASEAHALIAVRNATLWRALWTGLSGPLEPSDIERLVEMADGNVEALEAAARAVTQRYDDAAAIGAQRLLRRAVLHILSSATTCGQ